MKLVERDPFLVVFSKDDVFRAAMGRGRGGGGPGDDAILRLFMFFFLLAFPLLLFILTLTRHPLFLSLEIHHVTKVPLTVSPTSSTRPRPGSFYRLAWTVMHAEHLSPTSLSSPPHRHPPSTLTPSFLAMTRAF